jgi:hypothetical protein
MGGGLQKARGSGSSQKNGGIASGVRTPVQFVEYIENGFYSLLPDLLFYFTAHVFWPNRLALSASVERRHQLAHTLYSFFSLQPSMYVDLYDGS